MASFLENKCEELAGPIQNIFAANMFNIKCFCVGGFVNNIGDAQEYFHIKKAVSFTLYAVSERFSFSIVLLLQALRHMLYASSACTSGI